MTGPAGVPALTLWTRAGSGKPWVPVAEVPTLRAALDAMKGAGDFYVGKGDPNRPVGREVAAAGCGEG